MKKDYEVELRKIPLDVLIEVLMEALSKGAMYVDIIGTPDAVQDNIGIVIKEEYFINEESENNEDNDDSVDLTDLI